MDRYLKLFPPTYNKRRESKFSCAAFAFVQIYITISILSITSLVQADSPQPNYSLPAADIPGIPLGNNDSDSYPNTEYAKILAYSLYFYEAQRSGKLPPDNRVPWRHDSALQDGQDVGLNLTGGYYDAGDYLKFTLPLSWVITSLSWGILDWGKGYQLANQSQYVHDMIKWGTDWLIKAHPDQNTLYAMIGLVSVDNNYWGPDNNIPLPRPSFKVNSSAHGTDVAGETAAAFAASSLVFRNFYNESSYADILLSHAINAYAFAESTPFVLYQNSIPQVKEAYASTNYADELVWGALWLHRANNNGTSYLNKAIDYFNANSLAGQNNIVNWDDKTGAVYVLLAQLVQQSGQDASKWKAEAERYLDGIVTQSTDCSLTKGGLLWCGGDSTSASLNPALNAAYLLLNYAPYATSPDKAQRYRDFAISQIDYTLGKNPMRTPYVIGVHPNSPQNPHHAGASGGIDITNLNNPSETKYVLYGGLVGGPDKKDNFDDDRSDYSQTEVALDYNAPFQNLMAYQVINSHIDPYYVSVPPGRPAPRKEGLSTVFIAILAVAGLFTIVAVIILFSERKRISSWWKDLRLKRSQT
ncbi:16670_t:CDS:2 [Acaulospora morrowiae]|uniref:Endoglucanase n=1 Tax=Acaulospora morrowiae TaxID=94023 RepID=A0A9N8ZXQ9_9GLOM|nr:16670_t:CDS:2 [Acaulospora morrowiae]